MEPIISLVALLGMGYGVFRGLKWMMRAGAIQSSKNAPLSPTDLRVLEESAARLMEDLRMVTDECVARIEKACSEAQQRIERLDAPGISMAYSPAAHISPTQTPAAWPTSDASGDFSLLGATGSPVSAARESGVTTGEIELMRGLQAMGSADRILA